MSRRRRTTGYHGYAYQLPNNMAQYFDDPRKSPKFWVVMEPDIQAAFAAYSISNEYPNNSQAVNALIRIALAAVPEMGAIQAERIRAGNDVRKWAYERLGAFFRELKEQIAITYPTEVNREDQG